MPPKSAGRTKQTFKKTGRRRPASAAREQHDAVRDLDAAKLAHEVNNAAAAMLSDLKTLKMFWSEVDEILTANGKARHNKLHAGRERARSEIPVVLDDLELAAQRISRIIAEIRNETSESDRGKWAQVQLGKIVKNALRQAGRHFQPDVVIRDGVPDDLPMVRGDAHRLFQVFANLFLNAAAAMENRNGSPKLLTITSETRGKSGLKVSVSDTGAGIPPGDMAKLFQPFFTTRREQGGTGLGLFICRHIITEHGGELSVQSEYGRGATFHVTLPVARL